VFVVTENALFVVTFSYLSLQDARHSFRFMIYYGDALFEFRLGHRLSWYLPSFSSGRPSKPG